MKLNLNSVLLVLVVGSCAHPQSSDDLNEIAELSVKRKESVPAGKSKDSAQMPLSDGSLDQAQLKQDKRTLHMLLHQYAQKVDQDKRSRPAKFQGQSSKTLSAVEQIPVENRSTLDNSILFLAVIEKAVYSFEQFREDIDPTSAEIASPNAYPSNPQNTEPKSFEDQQVDLFKSRNVGLETLDDLSKTYRIDLPDILATSKLLSFPYVHRFLLLSLENMSLSDTLKLSLFTSIKTVSEPWHNIYVSLSEGSFDEKIAPDDNFQPSDAAAQDKPKDAVQPAIDFLGGDFAEGEDHLKQAKSLAAKLLYSEAIEALRNIEDDSPYSNTRDEMIKKYSNMAVKNLRRRAAQAFQSSIPAPEISAKLEYLREAEEQLTTAYEDYPEADQLEKVKENLGVIQNRINSLEDQIEEE